jgi:catechol 2,3-dioxygenase-like lactoylglutathione lyase family enzyme
MSNLRQAKAVIMIMTAKPEASVRFYRDVLGLDYLGQDTYSHRFSLKETEVRITQLATFTASEHPVLGFEVSDIVAIITALNSKGVQMNRYDYFDQDSLGIWHDPQTQAQVAFFNDPDGNSLSLKQT